MSTSNEGRNVKMLFRQGSAAAFLVMLIICVLSSLCNKWMKEEE